jgi:Asp-tRNA(Asn)/Glu-tRNA(Gln) amidotransferase A subunit family amidase
MSPPLHHRTIPDVAAAIRSGALTAAQVTRHCLDRVERLDATYKAFVTLRADEALAEAEAADAVVRAGGPLGPLHGVPISVKDTFLVDGTPTTVGSDLLREYAPAGLNAACVERLRSAGAIILGKVSVGSGMAPHLDRTRLPAARNPWSPDRTPGGSSSGSAVSVALGMAYGSIGTDMGGSIRNPSAYNGLVGLKPTHGRVSQRGDVYGLLQEFEHVGPIARTVRDAALLLESIAGFDPQDPTSVDRPVPRYSALLDGSLERLRIGWAAEGGPLGAAPEVLALAEAAVAILAERGARVEAIRLPPSAVEFWHLLILVQEWDHYDDSDLRMRPTDPRAAAYPIFIESRFKERRRKLLDSLREQLQTLRAGYAALFSMCDVLALPTVPIPPQPFGTRTIRWHDRDRDVFDLQLSNLWMFNATGHPAVSIPAGVTSEGVPAGLQIVGRHFDEETVFRAAAVIEAAVGGFRLPPQP